MAESSAGSLSEMSSSAMCTPRHSSGELVPFMEVEGIYGEVAKVSRARFVWLCSIGQGRGVGRYVFYIPKGFGSSKGGACS